MADFEIAVQALLKREGGFVDHPADRGGPTKFGISQRGYPQLSIEALTEAQARMIYKKDFWQPEFAQIPLQKIANKLFDIVVHMGRVPAVRLLQEALGEINFAVEVDGIFGPQTLQATKLACMGSRVKPLLDAWRWRMARHYVGLALDDPSQIEFLDGWLKRAVA